MILARSIVGSLFKKGIKDDYGVSSYGIVQTIRNLLDSQAVGSELWVSLSWMVLIIMISYLFGMKVYKRV